MDCRTAAPRFSSRSPSASRSNGLAVISDREPCARHDGERTRPISWGMCGWQPEGRRLLDFDHGVPPPKLGGRLSYWNDGTRLGMTDSTARQPRPRNLSSKAGPDPFAAIT